MPLRFDSSQSQPLSRRQKGKEWVAKWADEARFIRTLLENPRLTGAVSPSSAVLADAIAARVDPALAGPIIELGPGTGPITEALLRRGIAPERLILVEYDATFCELLRTRFPQAQVIRGDAYNLAQTLDGLVDAPAAAVVSGLPLLNTPERARLALLADAFALMQADGAFVQFTYGLHSPMPRRFNGRPVTGMLAEGSKPVWMNLPPARVWTYRQGDGPLGFANDDETPLVDRLRGHRERLRAEWHECTQKLRERRIRR
ncbi:class I SAM-dependent methyltransferase [Methylovirgula sp. 4M-Z18]|uniref:class I SAM-dependent methyltransferase n=1 Tax=Methylovirgula sp. 4M-Z18 TaxID=2293567 RepID=UPI000E2E5709|nr:rRNA adenine N-6-methyltransferase family protein [Methylovirgula sp. 4M-Z18]RFB78162.1 phospholipid methyltransferase [Methylovirgula sp. 4M-Z18]